MPKPQPVVVKRGEARNTDILCGRGNGVLGHPGNMYYLSLIKRNQSIYQHGKGGMHSLSQREKRKIVRRIIESIDELDPPGRFLKLVGRDTEHGFEEIYHVIEDDDTRMKKVSQALREKPKKSTVMKEQQQQQQQDEDQRRMGAIERSHQRNEDIPPHYMKQGDQQNNMTEQQRYLAMLSQQRALSHHLRKNNSSMMFSPDNPKTNPRGGGFFNPKRRLPYSEALRHPDAAAAAANMMVPSHKRQRMQHSGNFPMPPPPPHGSRHSGHHNPLYPHMMHPHLPPHPSHQNHPRHQGFPSQNRRFNLNDLTSSQGGNNTPSRPNGNGGSGPGGGGSNRASPFEGNDRTNDKIPSNDEEESTTNGGGEEGTDMLEMNGYDLSELKRSNEEMKNRYRRTLVDCVRLAEMIQRSEIAQSQFSANQLQSHLRNLHSMSTSSSSASAAAASSNIASSSPSSGSKERRLPDRIDSEPMDPQDKKDNIEKVSGEYIEKASIQNLSALMSVQVQEASIAAAALKHSTGPNNDDLHAEKETKEDENALLPKKIKSGNIQPITKDDVADTINKPVKKAGISTEAALLLNFASMANTEKEQDNETEEKAGVEEDKVS